MESHRWRAVRAVFRCRNSVSVVRSPSRMMRPLRSLTSLTPAWPRELVGVRRPSMKKTRTRGRVRNASLAHFSTNWGGTMARAVNGLRSLCTWTAPSEISVLPVPHSAITAAPRASFQRFTTPIIASVCAGNGLRRSCPVSGEAASSKPCSGG